MFRFITYKQRALEIVWSNPVLRLCGLTRVEGKSWREIKIETKRRASLERLNARSESRAGEFKYLSMLPHASIDEIASETADAREMASVGNVIQLGNYRQAPSA